MNEAEIKRLESAISGEPSTKHIGNCESCNEPIREVDLFPPEEDAGSTARCSFCNEPYNDALIAPVPEEEDATEADEDFDI